MNISHELQWAPAEKKHFKIMPAVKYLVVHHTESPDVSAEEVNRWHKERGWLGIGYHFLIRTNGNIERGRPANVQGAHAGAKYNSCSLGIALAGDFTSLLPTDAQISSVAGLLKELMQSHRGAQIVPHKALSATACPGKLFPWAELMKRLEEKDMPDTQEMKPVIIKVGGREIGAVEIGGRTIAPVRALAEALGHEVKWDEATQTIIIE